MMCTDRMICRTAHITIGGSGRIMSTARPELPYPFNSQAKSRDVGEGSTCNVTVWTAESRI